MKTDKATPNRPHDTAHFGPKKKRRGRGEKCSRHSDAYTHPQEQEQSPVRQPHSVLAITRAMFFKKAIHKKKRQTKKRQNTNPQDGGGRGIRGPEPDPTTTNEGVKDEESGGEKAGLTLSITLQRPGTQRRAGMSTEKGEIYKKP